MADSMIPAWVSFYEELAGKLLTFKDDRRSLIKKIVGMYESLGMKVPTLDSTAIPADIDPYTVYGLFNKGISDANRRKLAAAISSEFGMQTMRPDDFTGIPVLNNLNATFYAFTGDKRRKDGDIGRLWALFEAEIALADDDDENNRSRFEEAFDAAVHQFGLGWKLTMGLYWARPRRFIALDSRNRWFMGDQALAGKAVSAVVPRENGDPVPTGGQYLGICDTILASIKDGSCPYASLPEISRAAWEESERVNKERKAAQKAAEKKAEEDALGDNGVRTTRCWLYAPGEGAGMWDDFRSRGVMGLGWSKLGDLSAYGSKEDMRTKLQEEYGGDSSKSNSALAVWQFSHEMEPGDIVFAKRGLKQVIGRGVVEGGYEYDADGGDYPHLRKVRWIDNGTWDVPGQLSMKALTDITDYTDLVAQLNALFQDGDDGLEIPPATPATTDDLPAYTKEAFLMEAYLGEGQYDAITRRLQIKKNIVLQGPPGVGKTFVAKRLAYSMMGVKDPSRVELVQFHQSYSYEDFVEGYRPTEAGFEIERGVFYDFCKKAADDSDNDYFFIIDEINRGNLSRIFGELFMLIEADKRGERNKLRLLYSHDYFFVPSNVYLIGMMNTADRSLALLDYALRRRFDFFDLAPAFDSDGFRSYQEGIGSPRLNRLVSCVKRLNEAISADDSLGDGFRIGHSYLCNLDLDAIKEGALCDVVEYELLPLLREYWFDDPDKVSAWAGELRGAAK